MDRRDHHLVRGDAAEQVAERGYVGYGVNRAHLVEMHLADAPPVGARLRGSQRLVHPRHVPGDDGAEGKALDGVEHVGERAVGVLAAVAMVLRAFLHSSDRHGKPGRREPALDGGFAPVFCPRHTEGVQFREGGVPVGGDVQERAGEHVARRPH